MAYIKTAYYGGMENDSFHSCHHTVWRYQKKLISYISILSKFAIKDLILKILGYNLEPQVHLSLTLCFRNQSSQNMSVSQKLSLVNIGYRLKHLNLLQIYMATQYIMTKVGNSSVKFPLKHGPNNIGTNHWSDIQLTSKFNNQYVVIVERDEVKLLATQMVYVNNQRFEHGVKMQLEIGNIIGIGCRNTTAGRNKSDEYDDLMLCSEPSILNGKSNLKTIF